MLHNRKKSLFWEFSHASFVLDLKEDKRECFRSEQFSKRIGYDVDELRAIVSEVMEAGRWMRHWVKTDDD